MKYLLDTHVLLWFLDKTEKLSPRALEAIKSKAEVFVSIATLWETAIKQNLGKLDWKYRPTEMAALCRRLHITILPILPAHIDGLAALPKIHGDPFDRIIIAQAQQEGLVLITHDGIIPRYPGITVLW